MDAAVVDKEQERGDSFVNTSTRYAKIYQKCKIWERIMQIYEGFYSFFEDFIWLPMLQASQRALAKPCKGRNTLFLCSHYQNLLLKPSGKSPGSFQEHTPSRARLLNTADKPHQRPPWQCCFSVEIPFMYLCYLTTPAPCATALPFVLRWKEGICFPERKDVHGVFSQTLGYKSFHDYRCLLPQSEY